MGDIREIITKANFAPYNLMPAFTDTFIPLYLLGLLYAYWRAGGLDGKLGPETENATFGATSAGPRPSDYMPLGRTMPPRQRTA